VASRAFLYTQTIAITNESLMFELSFTVNEMVLASVALVLMICMYWGFTVRHNKLTRALSEKEQECLTHQLHSQQLTEQVTLHQQHAQQYFDAWQQSQKEHATLNSQYHALKSQIKERQISFESQIAQLENAKQQLKTEFSLLAEQILEQKSQRFSQLNEQQMQQLLKPMHTELQGFKQKVESIHVEELKQRSELKQELVQLQKLNQAITEQAGKLATALQGQSKMQGNWGELILENILDSAGLRLGVDYQREVVFKTEQGNLRPDVVVKLPQERHLVIDAKTSLNAYSRYVNAETELAAQTAISEHVAAVSARIDELASKQYNTLPGINSPEVVVLFMPIESAYVEAIKYQPELFQRAIEKNILVATPTTLLTSLNIVRQLWRFEDQNKHAAELGKRAERIYSKLHSFVGSMQQIGVSLDKAKEHYEKGFAQLYSGKGNLNKEFNQELTDKAKLELTLNKNEEAEYES
jgi:DNA recombination protein RmuC